jgi:hypothetical protein
MKPAIGILVTGDGEQKVTIMHARGDGAAAISLYAAVLPALDGLSLAIEAYCRASPPNPEVAPKIATAVHRRSTTGRHPRE